MNMRWMCPSDWSPCVTCLLCFFGTSADTESFCMTSYRRVQLTVDVVCRASRPPLQWCPGGPVLGSFWSYRPRPPFLPHTADLHDATLLHIPNNGNHSHYWNTYSNKLYLPYHSTNTENKQSFVSVHSHSLVQSHMPLSQDKHNNNVVLSYIHSVY